MRLDTRHTITIPTTTKRFVARDKFVRSTSGSTSVLISYIGDNFEAWFLDKIEEPIAETVLLYHQLKKNSLDRLIIGKLGGEEKAETSLTVIWSLMELHKNGKNNVLLTNSYANIFYVRNTKGELCAVSVYWCGFGWYVLAESVKSSRIWYAGNKVFARLPCSDSMSTNHAILQSQ